MIPLGHISNWQDTEEIQRILDSHSNGYYIKLLQYNIQLSGLDEPGHLWIPDRKRAVLQILRYSDVMTLQEVSHQQYLDIRQELGEYDFIGYNTVTGKDLVETTISTEEGLVIGWKKEIATLVEDHGSTWFSSTPNCPSTASGCSFPKALLRCQLQIGAKLLMVHNSHFAHDDVTDNDPRFNAVKEELALLPTDIPWISAGDRNFHYPRDTTSYQLYLDRGIQDSRHQSKQHGTKTTFFGYELHCRCNPIEENDFVKEYYLDVLFHSQGIIATDWISMIGEYDANGKLLPFGSLVGPSGRRYASDHSAVMVRYVLE